MPTDDLGELFDSVMAEEASEVDVSEPDVVEELDPSDNPDMGSDEVQEGIEETDSPVTESAESFNWKQYANQLIPVVDNGVEKMVTLEEARNGFMRQDDYTRKTQEVASLRSEAQWAQDVQEAMRLDPIGTLTAFAEAYGVGTDAKQPSNALDDLDDDVRPWAEQTLQTKAALEQAQRQLQEIQNRTILEDIRQEVAGLQSRFGADFQPEQTLRLATERNLTLEDAHWILFAQRQASGQASAKKVDQQVAEVSQQQQAAVQAARAGQKAKASNNVGGSFKASEIPADNFNDIGELAALIMAEQS